MPETVDDGTDGEPALRLPTMVVLIVIPLVLFMVLFRNLCYLASMVDVVSTEDDDDDDGDNEPSRVNEQSIRMDTYGEASPSSPSTVQDTTTQILSPVASEKSDLININMHTYLSLVNSFPSLNESLSDTISESSIDQNYV